MRKAGQLLKEMAAKGERATRENANPSGIHVVSRDKGIQTLSDLGISRDQSSRYRKLADIGDGDFEAAGASKRLESLCQQQWRIAQERIMWQIVFWICVGILIGWNLPQPVWAKSLQDKIVAAIKNAWNKGNG